MSGLSSGFVSADIDGVDGGAMVVGSLVSDDAGNRGTVQYNGIIPLKKGIWIGVVWEDPARGKNDGTLDGHRYFDVADGSTGGSFMRPAKLTLWTTFVEAFIDRYSEQGWDGAGGADSADSAGSAGGAGVAAKEPAMQPAPASAEKTFFLKSLLGRKSLMLSGESIYTFAPTKSQLQRTNQPSSLPEYARENCAFLPFLCI